MQLYLEYVYWYVCAGRRECKIFSHEKTPRSIMFTNHEIEIRYWITYRLPQNYISVRAKESLKQEAWGGTASLCSWSPSLVL